ncbi:unnamed protein product [Bursaphelenchus xylophilus]|uniref:(pine wood nematode) hypothetical protein n=1 Tax=Bursaphelenchus xylophilus TaxID=6326 RepID=A0A1I7SCL1_BURXY|nr:unnamed protein product [Bursaphelenchus xylophilus]CAG9093911.1 unnamed protein product [Bursaphelenchus xylophilus]
MKTLALVIALFSVSSGFKISPGPQFLATNGKYSYYINNAFYQPIEYIDTYCRQYRLLPAAIPDAAQNQFLYNALSRNVYPGSQVAIGLRSDNGNSTFFWLDGVTKYNYTNVRTDVAAPGTQFYALILNHPNLGGKWTPYPPNTVIQGAICEQIIA